MDSILDVARKAALKLFDDVVDITFVERRPTGEQIFTGGRRNKVGKILVSLNPNGTKAAVEWKSGDGRRHADYRIFRVEGHPVAVDENQTTTAS
jgi:hypothetical protein